MIRICSFTELFDEPPAPLTAELSDALERIKAQPAPYPLQDKRRMWFIGKIENHNVLIATGEGEYKITPDIQGEK